MLRSRALSMSRAWSRLLAFRRIRAVGWCALCLLAVWPAGCAYRGEMRGSLHSRRSEAYRRWQSVRNGEEESKPHLTGALSLQDALKVAIAYNKSLQVTVQERLVAAGMVTEAYAGAMPTLSATAAYVRLEEVPAPGQVNNYSTGLEIRQPLFRGGAVLAGIRTAQWNALLADEQVRGAVQSVIYDAAKAYCDVLLAQHLYEVNRDAVESARAHLRDVEIKRQQGVVSDFGVLRAQVDVSNFEAAMIQQRNRVHVARTELLRSMGASQQSEVTLSDVLTYTRLKPVAEEAVRLAYRNRPDLYQAELGILMQQEAVRIAQGRYWPMVDAWFRQEWARPDPVVPARDRWGGLWTAGLSASWTLFDGFGREGRIAQEQARLRQRELQLADAEERVLEQLQQAVLSVQDAEEFVESQRMNLSRASEAVRLAEVEYRQGIAEAVTVTEARAALTRAQGYYYEAVYSHTLARLNLQRAMGILGPRSDDSTAPEDTEFRPGRIAEFSPDDASAADEVQEVSQ
ncbi:MAG: TolC family protein [Candidatus Brocadiaceae bacterium]|nr:TolC family protein [Candidatus Brocadiaceae bacterium]